MIRVWEDSVQYRWITNYYDVPLLGTCYYCGVLYQFKRSEDGDEDGYWSEILELYHLSSYQKFKWIVKQWWFETCVGDHWSWYPSNRKKGFLYRKPEWLYKFLFKLYYIRKHV